MCSQKMFMQSFQTFQETDIRETDSLTELQLENAREEVRETVNIPVLRVISVKKLFGFWLLFCSYWYTSTSFQKNRKSFHSTFQDVIFRVHYYLYFRCSCLSNNLFLPFLSLSLSLSIYSCPQGTNVIRQEIIISSVCSFYYLFLSALIVAAIASFTLCVLAELQPSSAVAPGHFGRRQRN